MTHDSLFTKIVATYADSQNGRLDNASLYSAVADAEKLNQRSPVGQDAQLHNLETRKIRWHQQSLKHMGLLTRVDRGVWQIKEDIGQHLHRATASVRLVGFSSNLGVAIWAQQSSIFPALDEPIALCISSPPFPLRKARAYGNPASDYVDFICLALEPIVRNLLPGGSIVLNISNDIFEEGSPSRSLYVERLVIGLHDRLSLKLMDRIPWINLGKPPGPVQWASIKRVQLNTGHEHVLWFTNDPLRVRSDNRRVLEPHTAKHQKLMESGGAGRTAEYGDGAYKIRPESYGRVTAGSIPKNVFIRGHACRDTVAYRKFANSFDLPTHGAMYPTAIPDFFIRLLTEPDDLVVDPFGGTVKTGLAAERLGRRWLVTEWILEYLCGASGLFRQAPGFAVHPLLGRFAA